jgi:hypothetical protein
MLKLKELRVQYITDDAGVKSAVILPIEQFQELLEDLEDLAVVAERREEPTISHENVLVYFGEDDFDLANEK